MYLRSNTAISTIKALLRNDGEWGIPDLRIDNCQRLPSEKDSWP